MKERWRVRLALFLYILALVSALGLTTALLVSSWKIYRIVSPNLVALPDSAAFIDGSVLHVSSGAACFAGPLVALFCARFFGQNATKPIWKISASMAVVLFYFLLVAGFVLCRWLGIEIIF